MTGEYRKDGRPLEVGPPRRCQRTRSRAYESSDTFPGGHVFRYSNGTCCGSSTENGFAGTDANTLYTCTDGILTATSACSEGCTPQKGGSDKCD